MVVETNKPVWVIMVLDNKHTQEAQAKQNRPSNLVNGSFFSGKQLIKLLGLLQWWVHWEVGSGKIISFWYDNWGSGPIRKLRDWQQRPPSQLISVHDVISDYSPVFSSFTGTVRPFTDFGDQLFWAFWCWSARGNYTASSVYKVMISGGKVGWNYMEIWSATTEFWQPSSDTWHMKWCKEEGWIMTWDLWCAMHVLLKHLTISSLNALLLWRLGEGFVLWYNWWARYNQLGTPPVTISVRKQGIRKETGLFLSWWWQYFDPYGDSETRSYSMVWSCQLG